MIKTGLVSISFRDLQAEKVIELVREAGLESIEWGGDIHVPVGDILKARKIKDLMKENNLITSAYGTYYRVGLDNNEKIEDILETGKVLKTNIIRVWGARKSYEGSTPKELDRFIEDLKDIAKKAKRYNMDISLEYHWDTMTHTLDGVKYILDNTKEFDNIKFHWQPATTKSQEELIREIEYLLINKKLSNIHVYQWKGEKPNREMFLLEEGKEVWKEYLKLVESYEYAAYASLEM